MNFKKYKIIAIQLLFFNSLFINNFFYSKKSFSEELSNKPSSEYIRTVNDNSFYIIGPGDVIDLIVSEEAVDLNKRFQIDGEGNAILKRLKKIRVQGLSIDELKDILNQEYSKYVKEPDVELTVIKYRPVRVFIDGEVIDPGMHFLQATSNLKDEEIQQFMLGTEDILPAQNNIGIGNNVFFPSLIDFLRKAKGVTNSADLTNIEVQRINTISNGGGRLSTKLNILDTLDLKDVSQNIRILDGDTILVPKSDIEIAEQLSKTIKSNINPKYVTIFVSGRFENPGNVKVSKLSTLNDAIEISGGAKVLKGEVRFLRYQGDGVLDRRTFRLNKSAKKGSYKNPYLRDGDQIYMSKSPINVATEVIQELSAPLQGIVSAYGFYKIVSPD